MKLEFNQRELQEFLIKRYPNTPTRVLAIITGLSVQEIYHKAYKLKLRKSPEFKAELLKKEGERLAKHGAKTRFKPGHTPVNKGKTMSEKLYAKVKPTMFKKGHRPHNTKYDGHISIRKDKSGREYAYIRVREGEYKLLHRVIWEENNGPIPEGYVVVFKTKDTKDITLENLELITKQENMARNTIQRYPAELRSAILLNASVKRRIKKQLNK